MAKLIPAAERIIRARALIQKAREFPIPPEGGRNDFSYIANVKDILRQARDMVKFIPQKEKVVKYKQVMNLFIPSYQKRGIAWTTRKLTNCSKN